MNGNSFKTSANYTVLLRQLVFKNCFQLHAAISLCDFHARFHLHWLFRAMRNKKGTKNSKWKYVSSGIWTSKIPHLSSANQAP